MGLPQKIMSSVRSWINPSVNISIGNESPKMPNMIGGVSTTSGSSISPQTAIQLSAVYACIAKISETIAMLPVYTVKKNGEFGTVENSVNDLLNVSPDGDITSFEFRETIVAFSLLYGKGLAEIVRDRNGKPLNLIFRSSETTPVVTVEGRKMYRISKDHHVFPRDMIIIPALLRLSPVMMNRETLGLFKSAQDYASKFFAGGGVMNGLLTSSQNLTTEQVDQLLESWEKQQGKQTRMMPFGFDYHRFGVEPDKAQNTAAREFGAREICQVFNVPPAMIGLEGSSYGDFENQMKSFITNCIAPKLAKIEGEYNLKLLSYGERASTEFRHDMDELSRGDMSSRATYYKTMVDSGIMNRNEVRAKERLNKIEGGDILTVQINQIALSEFELYSKKIASEEKTKEDVAK